MPTQMRMYPFYTSLFLEPGKKLFQYIRVDRFLVLHLDKYIGMIRELCIVPVQDTVFHQIDFKPGT